MNKPAEGLVGGWSARDRKAEHIRLALREETQSERSYFDSYLLEHDPLPEIALEDIDLSTEFLGRRMEAPLLISCMTGGTEEAGRINRNLALAAEECGVALGVGSQRKAIEGRAAPDTFQLRRFAPSIPLLANLGAVQFNYGFGTAECREAIEMVGADALVLHLNVLQEAIQPEGQTDFRGLLDKMGEVARSLDVPIIAKEVGCGIPARVARALLGQGIRIVDTAGVGGTSWARIEARRAGDVEIGEVFADWGIPTPECIAQLAEVTGLTVIGSGGIRSGVDAAKAVALGADLIGIAQPFLAPAMESPERVMKAIRRLIAELKIAMLCVGARTPQELKRVPVARRGSV